MGEITTAQQRLVSIQKFLNSDAVRKSIMRALPRHLTPDRLIGVALSALRRTPKLSECSFESLATALVQASELGLETNGVLGQAYLIPRRNHNVWEANFQPGYKGLRDLAYRSGQIEWIYGECVYANDVFNYTLGSEPFIEHRPNEGERGEFRGAYAVAKIKSGGSIQKYMSKAQIDAHRKKYSRAGDESPWATNYEAMAMKTAFIQLFRWLPCSVEMEKAVAIDGRSELGIDSSDVIDVPADSVSDDQRADDMDDLTGKLNGDGDNENARCDRLRSSIEVIVKAKNIPASEWDAICKQVGAEGKALEELGGGQLEAIIDRLNKYEGKPKR